jgi:aminoglycoside 2'-N-acetyltransferase I
MDLAIVIVPGTALTTAERDELFAMCARAYGGDVRDQYDSFSEPLHVIGTIDGRLVTHALRVTRWLVPDGGEALRTAYVELVATDPPLQRHGYATRVMRAIMREMDGFDLAALAPSDDGLPLYRRLGWVSWEGPRFIRQGARLLPTPDEHVMIHRLLRSPELDIRSSLSAEWRRGELW